LLFRLPVVVVLAHAMAKARDVLKTRRTVFFRVQGIFIIILILNMYGDVA